MQTSECSMIKELPDPIDLTLEEERRRLDELGKKIARQEKLRYEGYLAFTDAPYSVTEAKATLCFD